jgi:predicted RNase H-like HicB family nuclease
MATAPHSPEGGESFTIIYDQEDDGRWLAEVPELPGVMTYGETRSEAEIAVTALALRVLADRTEQAKKPPKSIHFL